MEKQPGLFKNVFFRGLWTLAPIVITIAIVVWLFKVIDHFFAQIFIYIFGPRVYFPGLGLLVALILICVVGVLMSSWLVQKMHGFFVKLLNKMPLVKTVFQSIADMAAFFNHEKSAKNGIVVMIKYGQTKMLGFVCREHFNDLPQGIGQEGEIVVYIPLSFQIGGVAVVVPRSMVEKVDMGFEEALRFAATSGIPPKTDDAKSEA